MGTLFTYDQIGVREGLTDILTMISPEWTPLWSHLPKKNVANTYFEWQTQALPSATSNAAVEGAAWSAGSVTARVRTGNYTQIFRKAYTISRTSNAVNVAGVADEMSEQKELAMKNLVRDIEYQLLNGTGNSGASGTARETKGIRGWISTTNITGSGTGTQALTEILFNDCLASIKAQAGMPTDVYVNSAQKRAISGFTGRSSSAVTIPATEKTVVNVVDTYIGDFGVLKVHYHDLATTTEVLVLQQDMFGIGMLGSPEIKEVLPGAVDGMSFGIVAELGLFSYNQAYSGKITQLTT